MNKNNICKWLIQFKNSLIYSLKMNIVKLTGGKAYRLYEGGYINDKTYRKILDVLDREGL